MNGILSASPAQGPIRLLVGTHLLLLTQSALLLHKGAIADGAPRAFVILISAIGIAALVAGIAGERITGDDRPWWRRNHAR